VDSGRSPEASPRLRRDLGLPDAVAIGLGAIVGAGIFVVSGIAAGIAGPAVVVSLAIAGAAATANALSSAQLAAEFPQSGGTYEYGYRVLSPWAGFAAGWMFLASKIAAAGTVSLGLGAYLTAVLPQLPPRSVAVAAIVLFTGLNYLGVRRTSRLNMAIVAVSIGSLVIFAVAALANAKFENFFPFATGGVPGVLRGAAVLFFAYTGYARIATLGEEVREPRTTIPRAIGITIIGAMALYGLVAVAAVGVAGAPALASSGAPLRVAALGTGAPWLVTLVSAGAVTAMLGVILSQLLGLSRMAFAMSRRGDLPRQLDHVGANSGVPDRAVLVIGGIAALVAATGTLSGVAMAASFTILVYYAIANVAALRMAREAKLFPDWVPFTGLVACVTLAMSLSVATIGWGLLVLLVGITLRLLIRSR
jgi:basic amino acid/polyamine antiporter, APA family